MTWVFLDVAAVKLLHEERILRFGGSPGLRDEGLLSSAVSRVEFKIKFDENANLATVAASLGYGLVKNHAFVDGNKRVGLGAMVVFLELNGFDLIASEADQISTIQKVASGDVSESELASWVESNLRPSL